jgi:hypothetical protein
MYGYGIIPATFVLSGGYLLYPSQTRSVDIPNGEGGERAIPAPHEDELL